MLTDRERRGTCRGCVRVRERHGPGDRCHLFAGAREAGCMETTLIAQNGRTLRLSDVVRESDGAVATFDATLSVPGGSVTTTVHEFGTGLPRFFRELADGWRGFEDAKSFASLEGELWIEARHDGVGTIDCKVQLRQPAPPEWGLSAVLTLVLVPKSGRSLMSWSSSWGDTEVPIGGSRERPLPAVGASS